MEEIEFKVGEVEYKVRQPGLEELNKAEMVYNKRFNVALNSDSPLAIKAGDILRKQGLWSDEKQAELNQAYKDISEKEFILHKGGIYKKEARAVAISLKKLRLKVQDLYSPIANFNKYTCEGQAENAKFDCLVSLCTVYKDGRPVFSSLEDYKNRTNDPVAIVGSTKFAELHYHLFDDDLGASLPENQFLKDHGFVDDQFRLVDSKGRLVTEDGRLINEDGNLIDEEGNLIDALGHKLDKEGNFTVERKPFLDEADSEQDSATTKS
jgi:hypothetical protein